MRGMSRSQFCGQFGPFAVVVAGLIFPLVLNARQPGGLAPDAPQTKSKVSQNVGRGEISPPLRARWRAQQINARKAEAEYQSARLAREIAEIRLLEYEEVIVSQDLAAVDGEIKLAESDLSRARDRLDWARRMFAKGFVNMAAKVSEELTLKKAVFALEQAQSKKNVLVSYTRGKKIKEMRSEFEKARSVELAKKASWETEKAKEAEFDRQIPRVEPKAGVLVVPRNELRSNGDEDSYVIVDGTGVTIIKVEPKNVGQPAARPENQSPPKGANDYLYAPSDKVPSVNQKSD